MNTPPDDFDMRARAAGRELRQAAPADGLRRIQTARRNRRVLQGTGALAVAVVAVGGAIALVNRGDDGTIVTADSTVPPASTITLPPVVEPVETTTPAVAPVDTTVPPSTTTAPVVEPVETTVPPSTDPPPPAGVHTVWWGQKLAGWYDGDTFVPNEFGVEPPDGLLGTTLDLVEVGGEATHTATPTDADCSSIYLDPTPALWGVYSAPGAPLVSSQLVLRAPDAAEVPDGYTPEQVRVADLPGADPVAETPRLVVVDGWNTDYAFPTWITMFDPSTGERTTIEGDADPANALDLGQPANVFLDTDRDGNWEIAFAVGDGWGIRELLTGDTIVFGANHPCPEFIP